MIKISIDEAAAFDMLSVLEVKIAKAVNYKVKEKLRTDFHYLSSEIIIGIGAFLFDLIIKSPEYASLVRANEKTYIAVDLAKENKILAKEVDDFNYNRYFKKQELQKKFFKKELVEIKLGY